MRAEKSQRDNPDFLLPDTTVLSSRCFINITLKLSLDWVLWDSGNVNTTGKPYFLHETKNDTPHSEDCSHYQQRDSQLERCHNQDTHSRVLGGTHAMAQARPLEIMEFRSHYPLILRYSPQMFLRLIFMLKTLFKVVNLGVQWRHYWFYRVAGLKKNGIFTQLQSILIDKFGIYKNKIQVCL